MAALAANVRTKIVGDWSSAPFQGIGAELPAQYTSLLAAVRAALGNVFSANGAVSFFISPTGKHCPTELTSKPKRTRAPSREEVTAILVALKEMPLERAAVAIAAMLGTRPGESRGLRWSDWDRAGQQISIQRAVWHTYEGDPKTPQSVRMVAVSEELRQILLSLWQVQGRPVDGYILAGTRKDKDGKLRPVILDNLSKRSIRDALNRCVTCGEARIDTVIATSETGGGHEKIGLPAILPSACRRFPHHHAFASTNRLDDCPPEPRHASAASDELGKIVSCATNGSSLNSANGNGRAPLSPRLVEMLRLLAAGKQNIEIAAAMSISVKTVETYRERLMYRLNLHSTSDLVRYAISRNLVNGPRQAPDRIDRLAPIVPAL
jgi:DNA-binding CsgD family transcriptional regulator